MDKLSLSDVLARIDEPWRPKVVAELNGQVVQVAKLAGEFVWHRHEEADELFLGLEGTFRVELRERTFVLGPGELLVVPRGVEHRTASDGEAAALLFEPAGTRNTGDLEDPRFTAPIGARLEPAGGRHAYELVDVFTDEAFTGNPLAVFLEGAAVDAGRRQRVAHELNLSETTFVLERPRGARRARMEIFTPRVELPFAGHPTLGTAHVLARAAGLAPGEEALWTLEQKAGPVAVLVRALDAHRSHASFVLEREPQVGPPPPSREELAALLGLASADLGARAACFGHGTPFLLVELASLDALERARFDAAARRGRLAEGELDAWTRKLYPFVEHEPGRFRARMFAPLAGVAEDPATGSAAAALAAFLALERNGGQVAATIEQGLALGRPSRIEVEAQARNSRVLRTRVGGGVVSVGAGALRLEPGARPRAARGA